MEKSRTYEIQHLTVRDGKIKTYCETRTATGRRIKLDQGSVEEIAAYYAAGETLPALAAKYNTTETTLTRYLLAWYRARFSAAC